MNAVRELRPGDHIVYLFDRERVTQAELAKVRNPVLTQMAGEWLQQYAHRFFLTVAHNYQPIAGSDSHTFDTHEDSVLFLDKTALLENLPTLSRVTAGFFWVILATEDVQDAARAVLEAAVTTGRTS
jgi:hypothetical protein